MHLYKFGYIFIFHTAVFFIGKTTCETCINLFPNQDHLKDEDDNKTLLYYPDRFWRYNAATNEFDKLEYLKPNQSALCSVDFTNDLKGKVLKVSIPWINPYISLEDNNTRVGGFVGDIWTIIQDALKFRSVYTLSTRFSELKDGRFDVSLGASAVVKQSVVYYVPSTVISQISYSLFAVSEGTFVSKRWYIHIFHTYVWILSTLFVILLTLSMVGIYNVKSKFCTKTESCHEFGYPSFSLLCILGATSGQGFQEIPRSWSLRICTFTALCMGMLLSCGFNSTLTSYLAFRAPYVGINELEDVWKVKRYSICVRNETRGLEKLEKIIEESNETKSVKDKRKQQINRKCPNMLNEKEYRKSICRPGLVYVETSDVFLKQYRHVQDKCQMMKIRGSYWSSKISFLHYRGSKYWKIINTYILRLHSTGIIKYLEAKWGLYNDVPYRIYNNYQEVELDHVKLLIMGLFIAMIISIIICICENIWFRLHNGDNLSNAY